VWGVRYNRAPRGCLKGGTDVFSVLFHQRHLPDGCQHGVHVIDPHIRNPVNVNFCVRHEPLEIFKIEVSAKRGFGLFV